MRSVVLILNKHKNNAKQWELEYTLFYSCCRRWPVFNFISFDTVCGSKEHNYITAFS